ncbi:caspase-8-like isoform X2 [Mastacembelus armatus]|uniref:Caspase-8-like n=1 Tax=Mastacembelus armatus TaxID=205130 RepID=A0A3Q3MM24_9TELE|nr:caspase-8-like isoform X2 [Mastacembelus armatus]
MKRSKNVQRFSMSAKDTVRRNKTALMMSLSADYRYILNKVHEENLITRREYTNLKSINKEDVEGHVVGLVDKIMDKGENTCKDFLNLLETDEDIKTTYPELKNILFNNTCLPKPVQECSDVQSSDCKRPKMDELYQLNSHPVGLCVIINNENFTDGSVRCGTNKDAQNLAEVFTWLRFRVLMLKDLKQDQMDQALNCFASLSNLSEQLQEFSVSGSSVQEWSATGFTNLQQPLKHGDAFICCVLSHGAKGLVCGTDWKPLHIKQITRTFKATNTPALTNKPKVFLIQACQGQNVQCGVLLKDLEADDTLTSIPEEADVLLAISTVEDHKSFRHIKDGSWFIQSVCHQLKKGCLRGEDVITILHRVNNEVGEKEGNSIYPGAVKQMPEVSFTLRKTLVLSPHQN